jgi:chaperonin GroEL
LEDDELIGAQLLKRALEEPLRQLAAMPVTKVQQLFKMSSLKKGSVGYNVETGEYEDLLKVGIIDPTKVTRCALQNASSIASLLLTTEVLVAEIPEPEKKAPAPGPGGMEDMY